MRTSEPGNSVYFRDRCLVRRVGWSNSSDRQGMRKASMWPFAGTRSTTADTPIFLTNWLRLSETPALLRRRRSLQMPKGPKGQKRPADVIGNAVKVNAHRDRRGRGRISG